MDFIYKLTHDPDRIIRIIGETQTVIPRGGNGDWQLYEAWLDEGNTPEPAEPIALPIRTIDARRLRLALLQLNLLDSVESAIATLGKAAQIEWEFAIDIKENYSLVEALSTNLNLDTNAIFTLASSLE